MSGPGARSLAPDERFEVVHGGAPLPVELWRAPGAPAPAVLVISELLGLNDDIRRIARRLADHGYTAAAPDLYRGGHWLRCAWRTIAALQLSGGGQPAHELEATLQLLEAREDVTATGAIGFCMGDGFAMLLGTMGTAKVAGGFYGDPPALRRMQERMCPVVGGYGNRDRFFAAKGRRLEAQLTELGVPHDIGFYDGCGHSYMAQYGDDGPGPIAMAIGRALLAVEYDEQAAEDSWERMLAFFAEHLGAPATEPVQGP